MFLHAFMRFHMLSQAFICFYMLYMLLKLYKQAKVSDKKSAGHMFTGFYLRKPVKNAILPWSIPPICYFPLPFLNEPPWWCL